MSANIPKIEKKRVVIVGGGFAGLELVNKLRKSNFQIVLIDKNNFYQFLPLIYQVATAGLESSSISFPFRKLFQKKKDFYYRMAEVRSVNLEKKVIQTSIGKVDYDYLVFAAGAVTNYFGNPNLEKKAIPMKNMQDALGLRNTLLANFERALTCASEEEKRELLNVVVVGGGATGVEIAGAIAEMKKYVFPKDYPDVNPEDLKIVLVEGSDRLLAAMSTKASSNAKKYLEDMGVKVMLNTRLEDYSDNTAHFSGDAQMKTRSLIWVSGICGTAIEHIDGDYLGRGRRIKVNTFNQIEGDDTVFSIGDQCIISGDEAYPGGHPQLAQVAIQQAKNLANNLMRLEKGVSLSSFKYKDLGSMATVGRKKAVADLHKVKFGGRFAWLLWLVVHLKSILGVRNKLLV